MFITFTVAFGCFFILFCLKKRERARRRKSKRWEFGFTESFTTLQGQNGHKRIARAMKGARWNENFERQEQNLVFGFVARRRESFVCLSKHDKPPRVSVVCWRKRLINIQLWRQFLFHFFTFVEVWPRIGLWMSSLFSLSKLFFKCKKQLNHFRCETHSAIVRAIATVFRAL